MTSDLLTSLGVANLAAAAATLIVLAARGRARTLLGARTAYALWLVVPAAMLATLLPARTILVPAAAPVAVLEPKSILAPAALVPVVAASPDLDLSQLALAVWLAGVAVSLILLIVGQRRALGRFGPITADPDDPRLARAANPRVGPALVGVLRPRVIVPADFETRFDAGERAMILAHERAHLAGGDTAVNALIALTQAVNWFNPLVHLAARCARVDQELACDAAVVGRFPGERRSYAEALLKTQLASAALPFGCDWPVRSQSLLEERMEMLALQSPGRARLAAGAALVAALALGAGLAAWSAEPPVVRSAPQRQPSPSAQLSPQVQAIRDSVQAGINKERARQAALPEPKDDAERILRMRDLQMAGINVLAKVDFIAFPLAERQAAMIAASAPYTALSAENQAALLKLVPAGGWFSDTTYGDRAARASFSLARNFDLATQEALLRRLEPLAKAKVISGDSYGFLFDQVAIDKHEPQRYGTAVRCDGGKFRPYPIEDPEHVEQRRQGVGFTMTYAEMLALYRQQPSCLQSPLPPPPGMRLD